MLAERDGTYPSRVEVMGVPIDPYSMSQTVARALEYAHANQFAHFIGVNASKYLQMKDDSSMDRIVRNCEVINADGASMVMAADALGKVIPERVSGVDLMEQICAVAASEDLGIFLLGARQEVVEETASVLFEKYEGLSLVGIHNGFFQEGDYPDIARQIRDSGASIVFVGITSPKKERVIEFFRGEGLEKVFVGVGGSFDVISGLIPRAPQWMQKARLEWLFRMMQEPRRLFKRYFVGNVRFLVDLQREKKRKKAL